MRWDGRFRLAHELKKQLHELMGWPGPMTRRQFLAWQDWLAHQWQVPDRHDWYAMQTAAEVYRATLVPEAKQDVDAGRFKIKFTLTRGDEANKVDSDPRPAFVPLGKGGQPYLKPLTREEAEKARQATDRARIMAQFITQKNRAKEAAAKAEAKQGQRPGGKER